MEVLRHPAEGRTRGHHHLVDAAASCRAVGLGDLDRLDDRVAIVSAVTRAGARDVVDRLARGLDTQLGVTWDEGVEVSYGQWQKLALARGFMREHPLLVVLDEPTSALDAETEHSLFERYAVSARTPEPSAMVGSRSSCRIGSRPCAWRT
jgi:ATP-binding cassette subfamily B protein